MRVLTGIRIGSAFAGTCLWCRGSWRPPIGAVVTAAVMGLACCYGAASADCIDYGDYIHWCGGVDTPGHDARGVAVLGTLAYVADGSSGLQVIDITNPASPRIVGSVTRRGKPLA